jgi:hypothetical protein
LRFPKPRWVRAGRGSPLTNRSASLHFSERLFLGCFGCLAILRSPAGRARKPFPRLRSVAWSGLVARPSWRTSPGSTGWGHSRK